MNVKFQLEVDENKDAFPLHLSSQTPWILSIAHHSPLADLRVKTLCSTELTECSLGWCPFKSLPHNGHKSSVCLSVVLLPGLLFCSVAQCMCPCASNALWLCFSCSLGRQAVPSFPSSHTSGMCGFFWFFVLPYKWSKSKKIICWDFDWNYTESVHQLEEEWSYLLSFPVHDGGTSHLFEFLHIVNSH